MTHMQYIPGDPRVVDQLVYELKTRGIFDQFRKECIADVDTRPAYQNLRQRVETSVATFLARQVWKPDLNKNQLREKLRKHILDGNYLEQGVERIVDQVVNPKVASVFIPQVEDLVYDFFGIPRKKTAPAPETSTNGKEEENDLLPTDLEAVSPGSVKSNDATEMMDVDDYKEKKEGDDKTVIEIKEDTTENDKEKPEIQDTQMSGVSGFTPNDSDASIDKITIPLPTEDIKTEDIPPPDNSPPKVGKVELESIELPKEPNLSTDIPLPDEISDKEHYFKPINVNSDDDSSSDSSLRRNMSPLTPIRNYNNENSCDAQQAFENVTDKDDDKKEPSTFRFTIETKSPESSPDEVKVEKKDTEQALSYQFNNQVNINTFNTPLYDDSSNSNLLHIDYESDANSKNNTENKVPDAENSEDSKKEKKVEEKKSSKSSHHSRESHRHSSSKDRRSNSKHSSSRDSSKHDRKSTFSRDDHNKSKSSHKESSKDKNEKKDRESEKKDRDSSKHRSSHKSSSSHRDSKHKSSSSSQRQSSKTDERKSSSSNHKDKSDRSSEKSSRDKERSSRDSKSSSRQDKDRKSSNSSSSKKHEDKDKQKKDKKETDDHYSLSGRGNNSRRSTDRDSNDGSSSSKGSNNPSSSKSSESKKDSKSTSKSDNTTSSESTSPSDTVEHKHQNQDLLSLKPIVRVEHLEYPIATPPRLPFVPDVTLKKPKYAANLQEAKKLMKMRKFLDDEQKRMNQEAALLLEFQANVRPSLSQVYSSIPGPELEFACITNAVQMVVGESDYDISEPLLKDRETENKEIRNDALIEILTAAQQVDDVEEKKHIVEETVVEAEPELTITHEEEINIDTKATVQQIENTDIKTPIETQSENTEIKLETQAENTEISGPEKPEIKEEVPNKNKNINEIEETNTIEANMERMHDEGDKKRTAFFEVTVITEELSESEVTNTTNTNIKDKRNLLDEAKEEISDLYPNENPLQYFGEHEKYTAEIEQDKFSKFLSSFVEKVATNKMYLINCDTYEENILREISQTFGDYEMVNYYKNGHFKPSKGIVKDVNVSAEITLPVDIDFVTNKQIFSPVKSECSFELSSDYDAKLEEMVNKTSRQEIMEIILGNVDQSPSKMPQIDYCNESSIESDNENTLKRKIDLESTVNNNRHVLTPNKIRKLSGSDQITSTTEENEESSNNNVVTNVRSKYLGRAKRVGLPRPRRSNLPNSPSSDKSVENYEQNTPVQQNGKIKNTPRNKVQRYDTSDLYKPKLHYLSRRNNIS